MSTDDLVQRAKELARVFPDSDINTLVTELTDKIEQQQAEIVTLKKKNQNLRHEADDVRWTLDKARDEVDRLSVLLHNLERAILGSTDNQ